MVSCRKEIQGFLRNFDNFDWFIEKSKMAGRVERRINDKFYFVLDEVGGSSDCECEVTDNDGKFARTFVQKDDGQDESDSNLPQNNVTEFKHPDVQCTHYHEDISEVVCISEKSEPDTEILIIDDKESEPSQRGVEHIGHDRLPDIVDMEIDSDIESLNQKREPILKVTFRDSEIKKRLKSCILKFFSQKFKDCSVISNCENGLEIEVYEKGSKDMLKEELLDFNLDTTPGDNNSEVPDYGKAHDLILIDKNVEEPNTEKLPPCCFNCEGNHNLKDCKLEKNFRVINKNRTLFQARSQKERAPKVSRYHLDENQKFSHIVPGVISKKLRNALNLRRDQQPEFIYKMRILGYPPGWLEEAKVSHSGVAMYDDTGVPVLDEDEEEGEILPEGAKDKFDISKIIEFPGFNVPLPKNFRDETKFYRCPALSEEQSKERLINVLKPKTVEAYVKKSLTTQKSTDKSDSGQKGISSPTIEEMEEKKRQLLMELNNEDSVSEPKPSSEDVPLVQTPTRECTSLNELGTIKNLEFGTPILKSVSPFSKLPSREQFSCNINDVIQFENLPNSTGKYETIRHVITKIRTTSLKNRKIDD